MIYHYRGKKYPCVVGIKEFEMIHRLFLVMAMYCQGSSSQIKPITQPLALLDGWEASLGTFSSKCD